MSTSTTGYWPGQKELNERLRAIVEEQEITSACATCGEIVTVAPLAEARLAFRAHVERDHPELVSALNVKHVRRGHSRPERVPEHELLRRLDLIAAAA